MNALLRFLTLIVTGCAGERGEAISKERCRVLRMQVNLRKEVIQQLRILSFLRYDEGIGTGEIGIDDNVTGVRNEVFPNVGQSYDVGWVLLGHLWHHQEVCDDLPILNPRGFEVGIEEARFDYHSEACRDDDWPAGDPDVTLDKVGVGTEKSEVALARHGYGQAGFDVN
jgi:hypothetical protein